MPTNLSLEQMRAMAELHTIHEFNNDVDGVMSTVHQKPCWILEPFGCEVTTFDSVAEMYRRTLPSIRAAKGGKVVNAWFSEDGFITEAQVTKPTRDGNESTHIIFSWCEFNGDLMSGECLYYDSGFAELVSQALGESFFTYPGVVVYGAADLSS